jgi:hypothetical protein
MIFSKRTINVMLIFAGSLYALLLSVTALDAILVPILWPGLQWTWWYICQFALWIFFPLVPLTLYAVFKR